MNDQQVLDDYNGHGRSASYHYADDSGGEWGHARKEVSKAMTLWHSNPHLHTQMRELAKGFLCGNECVEGWE